MKTRTTKKEKIEAVELKLAKLWEEYALADDDSKMSLLRLETAYNRELQELLSR